MFQGFSQKIPQFFGFPSRLFQSSNVVYGLPACTFWLDAASNKNSTTNGASITKWVDLIRGYSFEEVTAPPTFISSDANFNNLPSIDFSISKQLICTNSIVGGSLTIAFVIRKIGNSSGTISFNALFWSGDKTTNSLTMHGNTVAMGIGVRTNDSATLDSGIDDTNPHIIIFSLSASGGGRIIIDGVDVVSNSSRYTQMVFNQISSTSNTTRLYSAVAEILVYNGAMSSADCIRLSTNLNAKYAIY